MKFLFLFIAAIAFAADPGKLAFEQGDSVFVAKIDGRAAKKIADGQAPELSPDGARLVFNTQQPIGQPAHRKIAVADLATGQTKVFDDVPSDNCLGARWSHDGSKLLFYLYQNNEMHIGFINADGSNFHLLPEAGGKHKDYWSAAWAPDSESIFGQDMENLYQLRLDGSTVKQWKIENLIPRGGMSGDVKLTVSPDGKTLLLDVEMDEKERKGWDGPPPAIWTMDLATEKVTRLTHPKLYAWDSCWLGNDAIVFDSQAVGESEPSIYRMSLRNGGKDRKLLVKKARMPSTAP